MDEQKSCATKKNPSTQSSQDKGMLLAKLLQRAVQNTKDNTNSSLNTNKGDDPMKKNYQNSKKTDHQVQMKVQSSNQSTVLSSRNQQNSSPLRSKLINFQDQNFSFDDSMSIEPSFATFQGEQVSQMLKYIYSEVFGQEKYFSDRKRYGEIQLNPDQYSIEPCQDFNKEGKMLQNIIFQIRMMRANSKNLQNRLKKLNQQLDQTYIKIQKQQKAIIKLEDDLQTASKNKIQKQTMNMQQKTVFSQEDLLNDRQIMGLTIKQLEEQNFILRQSIKKVEYDFDGYTRIKETQQIQNQIKFQRLQQLQQLIILRNNQIDHLIYNIGELEIELNTIKQYIDLKQKEYELQKQNETPQKQNKDLQLQQKSDVRMLSTIKEQDDSICLTELMHSKTQTNEKDVQTQVLPQTKPSTASSSGRKNSQESTTQLYWIVLQLKKTLAHKQKVILSYQKQIQTHQGEVQKYELFISQLSGQIQVCQQKLAQTFLQSQSRTNKKVQTDEKYFSFLNLTTAVSDNCNKDLTLGQKQDDFLFNQQTHKQPSIADQLDYKEHTQANNINKLNNNKYDFSFKKVTENFFPQNIPDQISNIVSKQKYWDQISVNLSQFSQTEELRDIRNLTKQLSEAYDKIISLTYEVNNLKNSNFRKSQDQPVSHYFQDARMVRQK